MNERTERITADIVRDQGLPEEDARRIAEAIVAEIDDAPPISGERERLLRLLLAWP